MRAEEQMDVIPKNCKCPQRVPAPFDRRTDADGNCDTMRFVEPDGVVFQRWFSCSIERTHLSELLESEFSEFGRTRSARIVWEPMSVSRQDQVGCADDVRKMDGTVRHFANIMRSRREGASESLTRHRNR